MNKRQKLVQQAFLDNEEEVINRLEKIYSESLSDIEKKAQKLQEEIEELDKLAKLSISDEEKEVLLSRKRSKVYQKQYQEALKKQVTEILDKMHTEEFTTVSEYLDKCYEEGFVGTLYDLQGQNIPLLFPIDQESMVRAIQLDSKISKGLYTRLGEDIARLKRMIASDVSRGISTGMTFKQIAGQLKAKTNIGYNNAVRIARTEGHRIQCQAGMDACYKAKEKGADVVKQWDATLDARTRESHQAVDGQIRELDEKFSNGLMFPGDPSGGAAEVINCRCALLQRARKALLEDDIETEYLGDVSKMTDKRKEMLAKKLNIPVDELEQYSKQIIPINAKDYDDFKKKYNGIWNYENSDFKKQVEANMASRGITINPKTQRPSKVSSTDKEQLERYQATLGNLAPKTLEDFNKIKNNQPEEWKQLKRQYRIVNQYKIDSGNLSAQQILDLDLKVISEKRNNFTSQFKRSGNIAGAYIDGKVDDLILAHSHIDDDANAKKYKGTHQLAKLLKNRQFKYIDVIGADGKPRPMTYTDTEAKIFEHLALLYEKKPFKTVTLLSERGMCDSCLGVMAQFKEKYNVEVNAVSNKKVTGDVWKRRWRKKS